MIMGVRRWGLYCISYAVLQLSAFAQESITVGSVSYPFANPNYSCRCLPVAQAQIYRDLMSQDIFAVHRNLCELKAYVRGMRAYQTFFASLFDGDTHDVATWFDAAAAKIMAKDKQKKDLHTWLLRIKKEVSGKGAVFKAGVYQQFGVFPFKNIAERLHSKVVRRALLTLEKSQSYASIMQCFQTLEAFVYSDQSSATTALNLFSQFFADDLGEQHALTDLLTVAYMVAKDLSDLTYVFYNFIERVCAQYNIEIDQSTKSVMTDLMVVYEQVGRLRIEETLAAISNFIKRFSSMINKLEQESETHFEGWLKNKWALIPLAVGVVIVKIVYYFLSPSNSDGIMESV